MGSTERADFAAETAWSHSLEAEQSLLGALLLDNSAYDRVSSLVDERDFYIADHRAIFRIAARLIESGRAADLVTMMDRLGQDNAGAKVPISYLGELSRNTPSAANIETYAELVRRRAILRHLYAASQEIATSVTQSGGRDVAELVDAAELRLMAISERGTRNRDFESVQRAISQAMEFIDHQYHREDPNAPTGIPYGFVDLDSTTSGMHPGQLIVLAARPAMGKSALALNITEHAASLTGKTALFFSLEMSNREQAVRLIGSAAKVNVQRLVTGRLNDDEWTRMGVAVGKMHELPIQFNDQASLTVMDMRSLARRAQRESGALSLIVVDYLQLMIAGSSDTNRANQLAEISRGLKLLAKELQVPVLALSQLNRELEKRGNKRPVMSDLRDSGAIEQDADVILFIYRDEVYHPASEDRGSAEIIICKQRNGPVGMVRLAFRADNTRFDNYAEFSR